MGKMKDSCASAKPKQQQQQQHELYESQRYYGTIPLRDEV